MITKSGLALFVDVNDLSCLSNVIVVDKQLSLSHGLDTIHVEKGCAEMHNFCMAAVMFLTGHGIKARTHAHVTIAHFPAQCIIGTWDALGLKPCASQALMMPLIGKCAISAWAWVLAILLLDL